MENIDLMFDDVYLKISSYIHKKKDLMMIRSAYEYVKDAFKDILRKDGSPYLKHLVETAEIVAELNAGPNTIVASLLHDAIEDIDTISYEDIKENFSKDIADLVEAVTKVSSQEKDSRARTVQKVFSLMRDDVRVIIIKIADRLNNMRTLASMSEEQKIRISRQTIELYAPVSRYLGLNNIAKELEELCLMYLDNDSYKMIIEYLDRHNKEDKEYLNMMCKNLSTALNSVGINNTISVSNKEVYKIYKYIENGGRLEEIEDLDIIHILVEDNLECYLTLGVTHSIYTPLIGRLKDYISSPKYNMYQAIHTLVIAPNGKAIKIAIATKVMNEIYEQGVSNKWKYDEKKGYSKDEEQEDIRKHLDIIKELDRINMGDEVDSKTYVKILEEDVFSHNQYLYVYSSNGEVIVLPINSSVLDFVFKVSGDNALKVNKILVNGLETSLDTKLKNGAIVMAKYSNKIQVSKEWENYVTSNYAKAIIRNYLGE